MSLTKRNRLAEMLVPAIWGPPFRPFHQHHLFIEWQVIIATSSVLMETSNHMSTATNTSTDTGQHTPTRGRQREAQQPVTQQERSAAGSLPPTSAPMPTCIGASAEPVLFFCKFFLFFFFFYLPVGFLSRSRQR